MKKLFLLLFALGFSAPMSAMDMDTGDQEVPSSDQTPQKGFVCPKVLSDGFECGREFSCLDSYKRHLLSHSSTEVLQCPNCSLDFHRNDKLVGHLANFSDPSEQFECEGCCNSFETEKSRNYHMGKCRAMDNQPVFQQKVAKSLNEKRMEEAIKSRKKRLKEARELKEKKREEARELRKQRREEAREFKKKRREEHPVKRGRPVISDKHPCPHVGCDYATHDKEILGHHYTQEHPDEKIYYCNDCSSGFNDKRNFERHKKRFSHQIVRNTIQAATTTTTTTDGSGPSMDAEQAAKLLMFFAESTSSDNKEESLAPLAGNEPMDIGDEDIGE